MTLRQVQAKIDKLVDEIERKGNTRAKAERYRKLKELRDKLEGLEELGKGIYKGETNPPRDRWIPAKAVKITRDGRLLVKR